MAIKKQVVPIPIHQGQNDLVDDALLSPPQTGKAENVRMAKMGSYTKRWGHTENSVSGNTDDVAAFLPGDNPAVLTVEGDTHVYNEDTADWETRGEQAYYGAVSTPFYSSRDFVPDAGTAALWTGLDTTFSGGVDDDYVLLYSAFSASGTTLGKAQWIERDTQTPVESPTSYSADSFGKAVRCGSYFVVAYVDNSSIELKYRTYSTPGSMSGSSTTSGLTLGTTAADLAIASDGTNVYVAVESNSGGNNTVHLSKFDPSTNTESTTATLDSSVPGTGVRAIFDGDGELYVAYHDDNGLDPMQIDVHRINTSTLASSSNVQVQMSGSGGSPVLDTFGICQSESLGADNVAVWMGSWGDASENYKTKIAQCDLSSGTELTNKELLGVKIKTATAFDSKGFVVALPIGGLDIEVPAYPALCRLHYPTAGSSWMLTPISRLYYESPVLLEPAAGATNKDLDTVFLTDTQNTDNMFCCFVPVGLNEIPEFFAELFKIDTVTKPTTASFGELTYVAGGNVWSFDGKQTLPAFTSALPHGDHSGTELTVASWYDAKGVEHRSFPSPANTVAVSLNSGTGIAPGCYDIADERGATFDLPALYVRRYAVSGSLFQGGQHNGADGIGTTAYQYTLVGGANGQDFIYTTGGELPGEPPPSTDMIVATKERMFLVPQENPNEVWYSKIYAPGISVEFNSTLKVLVDREGGAITALGVLDDKIVIFKRDRLMYTYGEGYTDTGAGSNFAPPQLVNGEAGCINKHSVVSGSFGLMFRGVRGIYMLDRGLNISYIGGAVEDETDSSAIVSAVNHPSQSEARFYLADGTCVVYNYLFKNWYTHTDVQGDAVGIYDDEAWRSDGSSVYEEEVGSADRQKPDGTQIGMAVATPWIKLTGINGFQRVRRIMVLLRNSTLNDDLTVRMYYNYDDSTYDDVTFAQGDLSGLSGETFPLEVHVPQQKSQSIKIEIKDRDDGAAAPSKNGYDLVGISLEAGVKPTLPKILPEGQRG